MSPEKDENPEIEKQIQIFRQVLESDRLCYLNGRYGKAFEKHFASFIGAPYAISCNSGTNAIYLALKSLNLPPGSEVITTPMTFVSTAQAIILAGLTPRFADIEPDKPLLSPTAVEAKMNHKTAAILPVHLFGLPCNMDSLTTIAQRYHLKIVEDCAQAFGSRISLQFCGTFGHAGAFSFCFAKTMTLAGEGGMVVTSDLNLAQKTASLRNVGYAHDFKENCWKPTEKGADIGFNMRLLEIQSALGITQLHQIENEFTRRRTLTNTLKKILAPIDYLTPYPHADNQDIIYYQFPILINRKKKDLPPQEIVKRLNNHKIPADTAYLTPVNHCRFYKTFIKENHMPSAWGEEIFPNYQAQSQSLFVIKLSKKLDHDILETLDIEKILK